ncbi:MAG: hypothetical protein K2J20_06280, partial [Bacilli bacterium]|nr:hypothetical protein [Bacilli bacterium]
MGVVEFNKFIRLEECTVTEYEEAKEYLNTMERKGTKQFLDACLDIVKLVVEKMYAEKCFDYMKVRDIYARHGLSDEEFDYYFELYFSKYASKRAKEKFNYFMNNTDEKIWTQAKAGLWEPSKLQEVGQSYNMSMQWIQAKVRRYFVEVLKFSNTDITRYKACYKKFKAFISLALESKNDFGLAYAFFNTYANNEEKEVFVQVSQQLLEKFSKVQDNPFSFLEEHHLSLYDIYIMAKLFRQELLL